MQKGRWDLDKKRHHVVIDSSTHPPQHTNNFLFIIPLHHSRLISVSSDSAPGAAAAAASASAAAVVVVVLLTVWFSVGVLLPLYPNFQEDPRFLPSPHPSMFSPFLKLFHVRCLASESISSLCCVLVCS